MEFEHYGVPSSTSDGGCIADVRESSLPAQALADLIAPWYYHRGSPGTLDQAESPIVTKGFAGAQDSHLRFVDQGDSWPIPGLVKDMVLHSK
jgi:hypothetical protein